jgi:hypothetical protein
VSGFDIFAEIEKQTAMRFNDPAHLPKPLEWPELSPQEFDEWDDDIMRDCVGGRLTKPVQALLQSLTTMKEGDYLYNELKALREAVKAEWRDL